LLVLKVLGGQDEDGFVGLVVGFGVDIIHLDL